MHNGYQKEGCAQAGRFENRGGVEANRVDMGREILARGLPALDMTGPRWWVVCKVERLVCMHGEGWDSGVCEATYSSYTVVLHSHVDAHRYGSSHAMPGSEWCTRLYVDDPRPVIPVGGGMALGVRCEQYPGTRTPWPEARKVTPLPQDWTGTKIVS